MNPRFGALAALLTIGAAWGFTVPLTKIAVATGHQPMGLVVWELAIGATLLSLVRLLRRNRAPFLKRHIGLFAFVALAGTILPGYFSYQAAFHLPAGVMAIVIAIVPMFALPIALSLGLEKPEPRRFFGLFLGLVAIVMIALPETSLPDPAMAVWVLIALIAPVSYAFEGNFVAWKGTGGLAAADVLLGASLCGLIVAIPLALWLGHWINPIRPLGSAEWALLGLCVFHIAAYTGYIWLVGHAGSVFASQVAYLVTGTGVLWSIALLSESYSGWIWAALALMLCGLAFVVPKPVRASNT